MQTKQWIYYEFDCCPNCGDDLMVMVDPEDLQDGVQLYEDAADVKCISCKFKSALTVDAELNEISVQDGNIMDLPSCTEKRDKVHLCRNLKIHIELNMKLI